MKYYALLSILLFFSADEARCSNDSNKAHSNDTVSFLTSKNCCAALLGSMALAYCYYLYKSILSPKPQKKLAQETADSRLYKKKIEEQQLKRLKIILPMLCVMWILNSIIFSYNPYYNPIYIPPTHLYQYRYPYQYSYSYPYIWTFY